MRKCFASCKLGRWVGIKKVVSRSHANVDARRVMNVHSWVQSSEVQSAEQFAGSRCNRGEMIFTVGTEQVDGGGHR